MIGGTIQKLRTPQRLTEAAGLQNRRVIKTQPVSGMFNYKQGQFHKVSTNIELMDKTDAAN